MVYTLRSWVQLSITPNGFDKKARTRVQVFLFGVRNILTFYKPNCFCVVTAANAI